jgi:radical SAM superfamily enzyme YgiQ (UPF0313 family)
LQAWCDAYDRATSHAREGLKMNVVLVGPELEENLTLRYLMGALQADGHAVKIVQFDFPREVERAAHEIAASGADIVGFSMVFTRRAEEFAALVHRAREVGYRGITIAGGHFAAFHAEQLLGDLPALDMVAIGEGEKILCALAKDASDLSKIDGLVWRDGETLRRNAPATVLEDLDQLPWPNHRRPFDRYLGLPIVNMLSSRGCTHACGFCSIAAWHKMTGGSRYRRRSPADVAGEMGCLYREGVRIFNFHDDNFLGRDRDENLARFRALRDELKKQGVGKLAFQIKARPDSIDAEVFILLRSMGLFRVFLGIEAGTETSLRNLGRGQKLTDNVRALELLNGLDLHVAFNLLVLNPESTFDDFADNVTFLRGHLDNPMNFCRTEIYQGTPLEKKLRKQDRLAGSYWGLDYAIDDERAERAFQLFRDAFYDRNFGAHPLHYLSGQVDYEHQLRQDFYGTTPDVKALAKQFIRDVNDNTVGHLEAVLAHVREGGDAEAFRTELFARVAADDVRLHAEGQSVLQAIREIPAPTTRARSGAGRVIAAAAALALAGCRPAETAPMEAAPPPPPTYSGAPPDYGQPQDTGGIQFIEPPAPLDGSVSGANDASRPDAASQTTGDAKADAKPDTSKTIVDTGVIVRPPPTYTAPMEAAPPPPYPTYPTAPMEAAPRWPRGKP